MQIIGTYRCQVQLTLILLIGVRAETQRREGGGGAPDDALSSGATVIFKPMCPLRGMPFVSGEGY